MTKALEQHVWQKANNVGPTKGLPNTKNSSCYATFWLWCRWLWKQNLWSSDSMHCNVKLGDTKCKDLLWFFCFCPWYVVGIMWKLTIMECVEIECLSIGVGTLTIVQFFEMPSQKRLGNNKRSNYTYKMGAALLVF